MTLKEIEDLLERKSIHSVFVGRSAVPRFKRFATLVAGSGETVARGEGNTAQEALQDAVDRLRGRPAPATQPSMPSFTRG